MLLLELFDKITETPNSLFNEAFWKWFSKSQVVDSEGKPLMVFHGTKGDIHRFDLRGRFRTGGKAYFFSPDPVYAESYARKGGDDGAQIYPVYLSIQNMFDNKNPEHMLKLSESVDKILAHEEKKGYGKGRSFYPYTKRRIFELIQEGRWDALEHPLIIDALKMAKFDGATISEGKNHNYMVFKPTQIKSTLNNGNWNPKNANIAENKTHKAIFYHGSSKEISQFSLEHLGTGLGHDQEGPGIYLTSSPTDATRYGKIVYTVEVSIPAKRLLGKRRITSQQIENLIKKSSDLDDKLANWDENPRIALRNAVQNIFTSYHDDMKEACEQIWYDFYYPNRTVDYLNNMVALGYDGFKVEKETPWYDEGTIHLIVFNPSCLNIVSKEIPVSESAKLIDEISKVEDDGEWHIDKVKNNRNLSPYGSFRDITLLAEVETNYIDILLKKKTKVVGYCQLQKTNEKGLLDGWYVENVYILDKYRGNNYAYDLYKFLLQNKNITIVSSLGQTDAGETLWRKLLADPYIDATYYDTSTRKRVAPEDPWENVSIRVILKAV